MRLPTLHLFVLGHPDLEQAAWVRADTITDASRKLADKTGIFVIVPNDYGWESFPDIHWHRNSDAEEWPTPHWEFRLVIRGRADLKGMPEYIRALGKKGPPKRQDGVSIGPEYARSQPMSLRSTPAASVLSLLVFHRGNNRPYHVAASEISGLNQDWNSVEIGKEAILDLYDENAEYPKAGDIVKITLKGDDGDHVVTGLVGGKAIFVTVVSIEQHG